ncbi:hypothetical protein [Phenylobacterium sp.]|uniref:hypothetical protein n=1 Tax=Phenylobacterium sp. TaxID=1871053 RepID=UPI003565D7A2
MLSGGPNPRWEVTGARAADLLARLIAASGETWPAAGGPPPGLGYRGLVVRETGAPNTGPWRLSSGAVEHDGVRRRDDGLEAALLATLPPELKVRFGSVLPPAAGGA